MTQETGLFPERLTNGDYRPVVTAYYFKQWRNYRMSDHTHRSMEIMYVIAGSCTVDVAAVGGGNGSGSGGGRHTMTLTKGEFIFLDGNVPHRLLVPDSCRMLNAEFRFEQASAAEAGRLSAFPTTGQLAGEDEALARLFACSEPFLVLREPHDVYHVLKSLVLELDSPGRRGVMVQLLLAQLLILIAGLYRERASSGADSQEIYVRRCIEYLHQNYDRMIQIKEIAAHVSLHPAYLQRIFKARTGVPIMEYLTSFRMEKAMMLLRQTDIPVLEIADYVGVGSRQYLHALFKKHTGLTPSEYRRRIDTQRFASDES